MLCAEQNAQLLFKVMKVGNFHVKNVLFYCTSTNILLPAFSFLSSTFSMDIALLDFASCF
jgi:hypothetical protein